MDLGPEGRKLYTRHMPEYIGLKLEAASLERDKHEPDETGCCKTCQRPWDVDGCDSYKVMQGEVNYWTLKAHDWMPKQPGDR